MLDRKKFKLIKKYFNRFLFGLTVAVYINNKIVEHNEWYNYFNIKV